MPKDNDELHIIHELDTNENLTRYKKQTPKACYFQKKKK